MSEPPALETTEYELPLSGEQFAELGRFTAICSQIDALMGEAISLLTETPWWAMTLMLENTTTGARVNLLRKFLPDIKNKEAKHLTQDICDRMGAIVETRNQIIHGLWARQTISAQKAVKPACVRMRGSSKPVFADDLRKLSNKAAKVTRLLGNLLGILSPVYAETPWTKPRRLFVADCHWDKVPDWLSGQLGESPELRKAGYPGLGDTLPKRPRPPGSSSA